MDFNEKSSFEYKNTSVENLSEFIKKFSKENDHYSKTRHLHTFVKSFLPKIEENDETKQILFFELISEIPELFEKVLNYANVSNFTNKDEKKEEISEKNLTLQTSMLCLEILLLCLKNIKVKNQQLMLLLTSLKILYKGYDHCQQCEAIYGDLLEEFKDQLASFFNKIQDVQSVMLIEFSKFLKYKVHSEKFHLITSVSSNLNKLCELVFDLDTSIAVELYKTFIELLDNYKEIGPSEMQVDSILSSLIAGFLDVGKEFKLVLKNKDEVPASENRIFMFKLNLIRKIISLFPSCIKENILCIVSLALDLFDLLILSYQYSAKETDVTYFQSTIMNAIAPTLTLFCSEHVFLNSVLLLDFKEVSHELQIPHLLLKLSAISNLLHKRDQDKMPERKEVIQKIFIMLQSNSSRDDMMLSSIKVPLSLFNQGKYLQTLYQQEKNEAIEPVTLYQHTYIHLNEYSKNILDSDLEELENFVLDFLHSCSSNLVSLLISDIWMHRLRCSSVENLLCRCSSFSCKLLKMPSNRIAILVLKRMVKFLPPNHKKSLFSQVTELKTFLYEEHKVLHRFGTPQSYNNTQHTEKNTCPDVGLLLKELKKEDFENHQQLIEKVCCILEFCTASINVLDICEFLRLIEFSTVMFKSEIYEIQVAVLTFVRALNFKKFNDKDPQFVNVRSSLASLFNTALRSKNYIIRLEALSIFCVMAQFTDIRITQETIARFPDLYAEVKAYMSQIPQSGFLTNKDKIEKMEKQLCNTENEPELSITLSEQSKSVLSLLLPS